MSYENDISKKIDEKQPLPDKLNISILKYFWQANPFTGKKADNIPKFLREIDVLKNFSDNELRILASYLHHRSFSNKESIFKQNEIGVGFYIIYSGNVDIIVEKDVIHTASSDKEEPESNYLLTLEKFDYFGELALLQESSVRNATAISREDSELLGLFKPDLEELIHNYPIVATKLLQSISVIISNRLFSLTKEVKELKYKLSQYEKDN